MAPNSFYTPREAALVTANLANDDAFLSALVSRNFANDLMAGGKGGAPVAVKMPTTLIARNRGTDDVVSPIVLDSIAEQTVTVTLSRVHDYSAVGLSEADLTLKIEDFSAQVLKPQAEAIVDSLEHKVATLLRGVPETASVAYSAANPVKTFTAIRKLLRDNGVAVSGINAIVGTQVFADLLDAEALTDASKSGSTAALREGSIGNLRGMTIVESTRLDESEIIVFHRDAVTLVTRAPVVPQGAPFGATVSEKGFSLRYVRDYDASVMQDRSVVSTFSGVAILPTYKVERNYDTRAVSVTALPNGGIVRILTDTVPV